MGTNRIRFYEFGPFRLDVVERQLWRDGGEVVGERYTGPSEAEVGNGAVPRRRPDGDRGRQGT